MLSFAFLAVVKFRKKEQKRMRRRIFKMEVMYQNKSQKNKF